MTVLRPSADNLGKRLHLPPERGFINRVPFPMNQRALPGSFKTGSAFEMSSTDLHPLSVNYDFVSSMDQQAIDARLNSSIASRGKWGYFVPRRNPVHNFDERPGKLWTLASACHGVTAWRKITKAGGCHRNDAQSSENGWDSNHQGDCREVAQAEGAESAAGGTDR